MHEGLLALIKKIRRDVNIAAVVQRNAILLVFSLLVLMYVEVGDTNTLWILPLRRGKEKDRLETQPARWHKASALKNGKCHI